MEWKGTNLDWFRIGQISRALYRSDDRTHPQTMEKLRIAGLHIHPAAFGSFFGIVYCTSSPLP
jgi:hypothetical protein